MSKPITHLITHAGAFHADDACAYAVLSDLYPEAALVRTRDTDTIRTLGQTGVVFDVGRIYDPAIEHYDHHQPGAPVREDGLAYAAFGLVWKHRGEEWLTKSLGIPKDIAGAVHTKMEAKFVRQIDSVDVGVITPGYGMETSVPGVIYALNPPSIGLDGRPLSAGSEAMDQSFLQAANLARQAIRGQAQTLALEQVAENMVVQAAGTRTTPSILVLDQAMPWSTAVTTHPDTQDVLLVVCPNSTHTEWGINCARATLDSFQSRRLLPESWRGRVNADLEETSGVRGVHFCHTAGFFAAAKTKEAACAFAQQAVAVFAREDRLERAHQKAEEMGPSTVCTTRTAHSAPER